MHWLLQLLVDLALVLIVIAAYRFYQQKRRREVEYARVQLYEDADKPFLGTPDSAGWPDPVDDERHDYRDTYREDGGDDVGDDEPLVSIATEPPPSTTPAAPPEPAPAASKKSGKSGKSGKKPKTKRWRDADVDDDMDAAAVQALINKELADT